MLGGDKPSGLAAQALEQMLAEPVYCIAADSGADHLQAFGRLPDCLVGDADSISQTTLDACLAAGVAFTRLPRAKDWTDGEAALQAAFATDCKELQIFGAPGGRLDHQLHNLLLPLAYRSQWQNLTFYGADFRAWYCFGSGLVQGTPGDTVSLLPLSAAVNDIYLEGFAYPLQGVNTVLGSSLCMSNELAAPEGRIRFAAGGIMLVIHLPQMPGNGSWLSAMI